MNNIQKDNFQTIPSGPMFDIVALAASAYGTKAIIKILSGLPADFPASIAIVEHIAPEYPSFLAVIFSRYTSLSVKEAEEGEGLQKSIVYVAPPNYHLCISSDRTISLTQTPKVHCVRPSADILFESVAKIYKERAIAVVLTGFDTDGANGVRAIKQAGGTTIAQNEATSGIFEMPAAAIKTGCIDFILPLEQISKAIASLTIQGAIL